jgi:hypothetical protein
MSSASTVNLPPVQAFHPVTFLERGVAVPFTTPVLANTRGRPGERGGLDFIVPNPSGGRGVYILAWPAVRQICRPTVHDVQLAARLGALAGVTPSDIRRAARTVLAEGLAGREAQRAAAAAEAADRKDRLVANFLLLSMVERAQPSAAPGSLAAVPEAAARADMLAAEKLAERGRRAVAQIAPQVGLAAPAVAAALEDVSELFAAPGVPGQRPPPRIPRLIAALRVLQKETTEWSMRAGIAGAEEAMLIAAAAQLTLACASRALAEAHGLTADMADLLRRWTRAPAKVAELLARPEWLLDGWEPICLLWQAATSDSARGEALVEMAGLVPVLPKEAAAWMDMSVDTDSTATFRRTVLLNEDWRTGEMLDLIARNEHLRALAA